MSNSTEFRQQIQRIGELVQQFEDAADPALRAAAKELVQLLMQLHGEGLEKMMTIAFQSGENGQRVIDTLAQDPLIASLMILHGLHPDDLPTRISRALERAAPLLRKHGGEVELLGEQAGAVRLRIKVGEHSCASTAKSLQTIVEEAIYEAAPDITSLTIEGADGKAASGFVALEALLGDSPYQPVASAGPALIKSGF